LTKWKTHTKHYYGAGAGAGAGASESGAGAGSGASGAARAKKPKPNILRVPAAAVCKSFNLPPSTVSMPLIASDTNKHATNKRRACMVPFGADQCGDLHCVEHQRVAFHLKYELCSRKILLSYCQK
jgi:hypothetical protein